MMIDMGEYGKIGEMGAKVAVIDPKARHEMMVELYPEKWK